MPINHIYRLLLTLMFREEISNKTILAMLNFYIETLDPKQVKNKMIES